jgi:hypothetical protein
MNVGRIPAGWLAAGFALSAGTAYAADDATTAPPNSYATHVLVSDGVVPAAHTDANLKNPWGIAFNPFGDVWVADNESSVSTLYDGNGNPDSLVVNIPAGMAGDGNPTGIVYNGSDDFVVHSGAASGAAIFIFAGEHGTISGWSPAVDPINAILVHDDGDEGAIYKGLALAANGTENLIYVTDFHNRTVGRLQQPVRGGRRQGRLPGLEDSAALRALRHPQHPRQPLRDLCEAGRRG